MNSGQLITITRERATTELPPIAAWDQQPSMEVEEEEEEDVVLRSSLLLPINDSPSPLTQQFDPSPAMPSFLSQHVLSLLAHTPQLTSLTLTVFTAPANLARCLLHALGMLAVHTPLLETVGFEWVSQSLFNQFNGSLPPHTHAPAQPAVHSASKPPLDLSAVQSLAARYQLPSRAFGRLRSLRQLSEPTKQYDFVQPLMSLEAVEWIRSEWFSSAPLDASSSLLSLFMASSVAVSEQRE